MRLRNFLWNQLPLILWAASIFVLSGMRGFPVTRTPIGFDKIAHFVLFFVFCGLGWRAFFHQLASRSLKRQALLCAFLLAVLYGALDEFHQYYVPGRQADLYDLLADGLGALGYVIWHRFRSRGVVQNGGKSRGEV